MATLITAVLPIAIVAAVGVMVGRAFEIDQTTLARINIYAMLPALVFISLAKTTLNLSSAIAIIATFLINTGLLYLIAVGLSRWLQLAGDERKSLIATTIFANVGNMGLPFVLFALGDAGLERAVVYLVGSSVMIASVFPIILKGAGLRAGARFTLRLPVFWAAMTGLGWRLVNLPLPETIDRGLTLLGNGAIPLALLTLGIQLSQTKFVFGRFELVCATIRLIVSPLMVYGLGHALSLESLDLQVVMLQAAMPTAVNSLIWVTELGGNPVRVARTIILSTLLSFITLPGVLWLSGQ
ncbi:MAG: AEC family transporter [Cyanobacteria bacterium P01_D01_bin.128]